MNTLYAEKLFAHPGDGRMPVVQRDNAEDAMRTLEHQRDTLLEEAEQERAVAEAEIDLLRALLTAVCDLCPTCDLPPEIMDLVQAALRPEQTTAGENA